MERLPLAEHDDITVRSCADITYLTLNRPEKLNAINLDMSRTLLQLLRQLSDDDTTRVVVLSGSGRAFCAGGDLSIETSFTGESFRRELELYAETVLALLSCAKPVICELNGDAVGWGATLALFCDVIIADRRARLGDPHVNIGLSTGDGASVIWPQLVGYPRARQFLLTGDFIGADLAAEWGLINEAVETALLRERVDSMAKKITSKPPFAIAMTKASINIPLKKLVQDSMDTYIAYESQTQQHPDHLEALNDFLERQKARRSSASLATGD